MKVLVRKSVAGAEYWDTKEKRSIFVPKGMEPDFEVTANPKSMIIPESKKVPVTVIDDANEITGGFIKVDEDENKDKQKQPDSQEGNESVDKAEPKKPDDLENKTVKELRAMAKKEGIDIPNAIRTKGDIINIIESAR